MWWFTDRTYGGPDGTGYDNDTYTIHEVYAPAGYERAEDYTFKIFDGFYYGAEVEYVNTKIEDITPPYIEGTLLSGEREIITVTNKGGEAPGNPDPIEGIIEQNIYKVVKVTNTFIPSECEMSVLKVDTDNNPLAGAVLQIIDAEGNVVDEWTSTLDEHRVSLEYGSYTLHEKTAPRGYRKAADVEFEVYEGCTEWVVMVDEPIGVLVSTGGTGTVITIVMAAIFGGFAGALIYLAKKKEKEEAESNKTTETEEAKNE